jgi:hypothetical protein
MPAIPLPIAVLAAASHVAPALVAPFFRRMMLQPRRQPYFLEEAVRAQACGEIRVQDLERDRPVVLEIAR